MTLFITLCAAAIASLVWYSTAPNSKVKVGVLALMYWGAALMWTVDGVANLIDGEALVEITETAVMLDDAVLGFFVVVAGLVAWTIYLCIKDPKKVFRKALS